MSSFAVIEIADGMTIVEIPPGQTVEDAAVSEGGVVVDPGPYTSYEDAVEALEQLEEDSREDYTA